MEGGTSAGRGAPIAGRADRRDVASAISGMGICENWLSLIGQRKSSSISWSMCEKYFRGMASLAVAIPLIFGFIRTSDFLVFIAIDGNRFKNRC